MPGGIIVIADRLLALADLGDLAPAVIGEGQVGLAAGADLLGAAIGVVLGDTEGTTVRGLELLEPLLVVIVELDRVFNILAWTVDLAELTRLVVAQAGGALDGTKAAISFGAVAPLGELGRLTLAVVPVIQSVFPLGIDAGTDHRAGFQGSVVRIFVAREGLRRLTSRLSGDLGGAALFVILVLFGNAIFSSNLDQLQLRIVAIADIAPAAAGAAGTLDGRDQGHAVADFGGVDADLTLAVGDLGLAGGAEVEADLAHLVGMGGEDRPIFFVICPAGVTDAPLVGDAGEVVAVVGVFVMIDPRRALMPGDLLQVAHFVVAVAGLFAAGVVEGLEAAVGVVIQAQFAALGSRTRNSFP